MIKIFLLIIFLLVLAGLINKRVLRVIAVLLVVLMLYREVKNYWIENYWHVKRGANLYSSYHHVNDYLLKFVQRESFDVVDVNFGTKISIISPGGSIRVTPWDKDNIRIKVIKRAVSKKDLKNIKVSIETKRKSSDESSLDSVFITDIDSSPSWDLFGTKPVGKVDYQISMPYKMASLFLEAHSDIDVSGLNVEELNVKNRKGRVVIDDIKGVVSIYAVKGSVNITSIRGNVSANVLIGNVNCSNIFGSISLESKKGSVCFSNIVGPVDISLKRGDITLVDLLGKLNIDSLKGSISVDKAKGPIAIQLKHGSVELRDVYKEANVFTNNGSIDIYRAVGAEGKIRGRTLSGQVTVRDSQGHIVASSREVTIG